MARLDTARREAETGRVVLSLSHQLAWAIDGVVLLLCSLLTFLVYGQAVRFSFTFDDPLDLPRGEGRSIWSLFTSSEGYAYYRPIPFVIWKVLRGVQGYYSEAVLHGLTLICHTLAAWVLYLLLRRLTGTYWGIVPAILFLTYPLSYQAVFGAHTIFHPLMTVALLLALLCYVEARQRRLSGQPGRAYAALGCSLVATLIGLWTHESGVVILPLALLLELVIVWPRRATSEEDQRPLRPVWWPALHGAAAILFLLVWRAVPKFDRPELWTRDSLLPNARYLLEGVIWPVAAQLQSLSVRFGFDPVRVLWSAIALTLLVLVALYLAGCQLWTPLVALLATGAILFPAWLLLTWTYLEDAPRLLYPAVPAIAALWGLLPALRFRTTVITALWRVVSLALLAALVVQNLAFINLRRDMWAEGTKLVHAVADAAAAAGDRPSLFLNVPAWFAPKSPEYPVGHVGLTVMPGYIGLGRVTYLHRGVQPPVESRGYYPDLNGWKYDFNTHGGPASLDDFATLLHQVDAVYLVEMLPESGAAVRLVGGITPNSGAPVAPAPRFGDAVVLVGSTVTLTGTGLHCDLTWQVVQPVPGDFLPVLRVRDSGGAVVAEWRTYPIAGIAAPRLWRVGDRVHDLPVLQLPGELPPGRYRITLAWEEKTTRQPLPGVGADGAPLAGSELPLGEFTLP